jgi:Na+/H+ antiporter NhaA
MVAGRWRSLRRCLVVAAVIVLERLHVRATVVFVGLGVLLWVACDQAGIHPTIAGVMMGLLTPVHARPDERGRAVGPAPSTCCCRGRAS